MRILKDCPACRSADVSFRFQLKDYFLTKETFDIHECNHCTLRFTNPAPEESEIGKYYASEDYFSHTDKAGSMLSRVYNLVRGIAVSSKRKLIVASSQLKQGKILDIGCGTGEFLGEMQQFGWESFGVEPNEQARAQAIGNHHLQVVAPEKFEELSDHSFDVITLWHVLEHIHELDDYMTQITRLLKPKGVMIFALPNYRSLDASIYDHQWAGYDVPRHLYHFSKDAFTALLDRFQMTLINLKPMHFDPFYVSILSEKFKKNGGSILGAMLNGLQSFIGGLFNKERSSSIIYIVSLK